MILSRIHRLAITEKPDGQNPCTMRAGAAALPNKPLQLTIPPQGHRCRIEWPTRRRACS